jgi:hypothetical protein
MKKLSLALAVVIVVALTPLAQANATILFAGGEDSDFVNLNGAAASTTAGTFAAGYARESMAVNTSTASCATASPPAAYFMTPTFTANSVIWIHANFYLGGGTCSGIPISDVLRVYSPDGYARIVIEQQSATAYGQYNIYTRNQAGTQTLLVSMATPCFDVAHLVPLDLYINYASSGEVTLYCNNVQVADYTGNILTDSATQLDQVQFSTATPYSLNITYWSEIIVSTTTGRGLRLATLAPAANGNTDNWDTGGVSNVNKTTLNTTTVNASGTSGEIQEYTINALPSGTFGIVGVWLNAYTQVDATGPQHLQGIVYTGSTAYTSSNLSPPQSAWGFVSTNWLTNPNTGVAWTTIDLGASGFNIGFESQN